MYSLLVATLFTTELTVKRYLWMYVIVMLVYNDTFNNISNKCYINTTRNPWHKIKGNITRH